MEQYATYFGWAGMVLIVLAYYLNSTHRLSVRKFRYHFMNLAGSGLLGYSVYVEKVWSSLFLQIAWALIALMSIIHILKRKK